MKHATLIMLLLVLFSCSSEEQTAENNLPLTSYSININSGSDFILINGFISPIYREILDLIVIFRKIENLELEIKLLVPLEEKTEQIDPAFEDENIEIIRVKNMPTEFINEETIALAVYFRDKSFKGVLFNDKSATRIERKKVIGNLYHMTDLYTNAAEVVFYRQINSLPVCNQFVEFLDSHSELESKSYVVISDLNTMCDEKLRLVEEIDRQASEMELSDKLKIVVFDLEDYELETIKQNFDIECTIVSVSTERVSDALDEMQSWLLGVNGAMLVYTEQDEREIQFILDCFDTMELARVN